MHVSVFCKLQDFIKQLGCCVTCFHPGDAEYREASATKPRTAAVWAGPEHAGPREPLRGEAAGDQGPGPPQPPVARGNLQPWKVRRREAAGGESSARRKWSSHDG